MSKNKVDEAKIYAETVIRQRKEAINVRKFGVKMSALASKIESAARTNQMSQTMKSTIPILTKAMKQMDSNGIGKDISKFEKVFEDMEVKNGEMDAALENVYGASIA
jgi:division protein CdvB (Snf7/Vps24/ESCRT-III family)